MKGNILFICTHGIGDLLMTIPTIRVVQAQGYGVDLILKSPVEKQVAVLVLGDCCECKLISELPGSSIGCAVQLIAWIRKRQPDAVIAQYGVSAPQFSLLAFLGGVKKRLGWKGKFCWLIVKSKANIYG